VPKIKTESEEISEADKKQEEEIEKMIESSRKAGEIAKITKDFIRQKIKTGAKAIEIIQEIEKKSMATGDIDALSKEDKELLALTLEFLEESDQNVKLFTNDYSMENVCSKLKIPFSPLYKEGIKSIIIWEVYCPFCKIIYNPEDLSKNCEKCGLLLKRRPKRINGK